MKSERVPFTEMTIALVGAPLAWTLHLSACYLVVAIDCTSAWDGAVAVVVVLTVVFTILCIAAGIYALNRWRRVQQARSWEHAVDEAGGDEGLFMLVGVMLALIFTPLILMNGVSVFLVPVCAP